MLYWDPRPEAFFIPIVKWPIYWYGIFFTFGFLLSFPLFVSIVTRYWAKERGEKARQNATELADRLIAYIVIGTIVGARLGHFLFYERPSDYLSHLGELFRIWEGGLASHGAILGIFLSLALFTYRHPTGLSWMRLLDFLSVPAALVASLVRVGNFFNQEILGTPTSLSWAVTFGHPADHSLPLPRHPAQLYEAAFYLFIFFLLWRLSYKVKFLNTPGKLIGLFFLLVFGFRFAIEFLKVEQSRLLTSSLPLTMGQWLSIIPILLGFVFYFRRTSPPD